MRIRPLRDGAVVEVLEKLQKKETRLKSFMNPEKGEEEIDVTTRITARVIAVGPGNYEDGILRALPFSVGDTVLLSPRETYTSNKVEYDGKECVLVDGYEVIAVVED